MLFCTTNGKRTQRQRLCLSLSPAPALAVVSLQHCPMRSIEAHRSLTTHFYGRLQTATSTLEIASVWLVLLLTIAFLRFHFTFAGRVKIFFFIFGMGEPLLTYTNCGAVGGCALGSPPSGQDLIFDRSGDRLTASSQPDPFPPCSEWVLGIGLGLSRHPVMCSGAL